VSDLSPHAAFIWGVITRLGSAGLILPLLVVVATGLWMANQTAAVRSWLLALALAVLVTMTIKVLFLGWGLGISFLDFTGISGHTLLASSVLPVFFNWLLATDQRRYSSPGMALGFLASMAVGASRIVLGAHSSSEVVIAGVFGVAVSVLALDALEGPVERPGFARLTPLVLFLALGTTTANYLPTHDWELKLSTVLSGRDKPYTRCHLKEQASIGQGFSRYPSCPGTR